MQQQQLATVKEVCVKEPLKGEHIFPATIVEPLAVKWKELTAAGKFPEASELLEDIVCKSSQMFSRLAQYEGYHHTVELESLVLAAQARVATWLLYWDPLKGKLFSWLSKCAKHVFLSEVVRTSNYRKRYYPTSDNLDKFIGTIDHAVVNNEATETIKEMLRDLRCRWGDEQSIGCIRFHIACIVENPKGNKKAAIRAGAYASGLSIDLSKFFHNWALFSLRDALYDKMPMPYTEQDLVMLAHSHTYLPDLLTIFPWKKVLEMIAKLGGSKIKIPTLAQIDKLKAEQALFSKLERCNHDPDSVAKIAKEHHTSILSAQEIYERMAHDLHDDRSGDYALYE